MRRLSGRTLTLVVLSLVALSVLITGLAVWAVTAPALSGATVARAEGLPGEIFTFTVTYRDDENSNPTTAQIRIQNPDGTWGAWANMTSGGQDPTVPPYRTYTYQVALTNPGWYHYQFNFVDAEGLAAPQNANVYNGPFVLGPPTNLHMFPVPGTGTGVYAGTENTTFTFFATSPYNNDPAGHPVRMFLILENLASPGVFHEKEFTQAVSPPAAPQKEFWVTIDKAHEAWFTAGQWKFTVETRRYIAPRLDNETAEWTRFDVSPENLEEIAWDGESPLTISPDDGPTSFGVGSGSSRYTFSVRYSHQYGLRPRQFRRFVDDPWETIGGPTGVVLWIEDYAGVMRPHFMVWDTEKNGKAESAATPADYAAGVWYVYVLQPDNAQGTVFSPQVAAVPGHVLNNQYTSFGYWDIAAWSHPSGGVAMGVLDYRFETTADYRPRGDLTNFDTPTAAYPTGNDDKAGTTPASYDTELRPIPGPLQVTVRPVLARGGCTNDILDTTPAWAPETYFGLRPQPNYNYWPLINEGRSRGTTGMTYDFYVKYYDPAGIDPVYVAVYILENASLDHRNLSNYVYHRMTKSDTTHPAGNWYVYTTTLSPGIHYFYFEAFDGSRRVYFPRDPRNTPAGQTTLTCGDTNRVNNPLQLSNASVSPTTGPEGTAFTYQVRYTDLDDDPPRYAFVDIYDPMLQLNQDAGGNPLPGTVLARSATTITANINRTVIPPLSYFNGWYIKMISGQVNPNATSRGHYFRIANVTGAGPYTFTLDQTVLVDDVTKRNPAGDGVQVGDQFVIVYRGAMQDVDPSDTTYSNGKDYSFVFNQFHLLGQPRSLRYAFTFADNWGTWLYPSPGEVGEFTNLPSGDRFGVAASYSVGPSLTAASPGPTLSAPAVSATTPDGVGDSQTTVDPNAGTSATTFRFRVRYTHPDGTAPAMIQVGISNTANQAANSYGAFTQWVNLSAEDSNDIKLGRTYYADLRLPAVADINGYALTFRANDGTANAVLNASDFPADAAAQQGQFGPAVHPNTAPTLSGASVTWTPNPAQPPNLDSTVTYRVTYTDTDHYAGVKGNPPTELWLYIDGFTAADRVNMLTNVGNPAWVLAAGPTDPNDTDYTNGREYYLRVQPGHLILGAHKYFFLASDGADNARLPADGFNDGPNIQDRAPTLTGATVSTTANSFLNTATTPNRLVAPPNSTFRLRVTYTDLDGDLPQTNRVRVTDPNGIVAVYDLLQVSAADTNVKDGKDYYYDVTLTVPGLYGVLFEANNAKHTALVNNTPATNPVPVIETNLPPEPPVPLSPADGAEIPSARPNLQWTPAAPKADRNRYDEADSLVYRLEVDTASTFNTPNKRSYGPTAAGVTSFAIPTNLTPGTWFWRVAAVDQQGEQSAWSGVFRFTYQPNRAPSAPTDLNPRGGIVVRSRKPTLTWRQSTDPDSYDPPGSLTYRVQVTLFSDPGYGSPLFTGNVVGVGNVAVDVALPENAHLRWRVRASDAQGANSAWSSEADFFVNSLNEAPGTPVLTEPANGTTVTTLTPWLRWTPAATPDPDPGTAAADLSYEIRIADNDQFTNSTQFAVGAGVNQFQLPAGAVRNGVPFWWQVRAVDPGRPPAAPAPAVPLASAWSAAWSFTVRGDHPPTVPPAPYSPSDGGIVNQIRPTLRWGASTDPNPDDTPDTLRYRVQLVDEATYLATGFGGPFIFNRVTAPGTTRITLDVDLVDNTRYRWRVRALDEMGNASDYCPVQNFWVNLSNQPPNPPVGGFLPTNGETVTTLTPTLRWNKATDPDPDDPLPGNPATELAYIVQLSRTSDFATVAYQFTTPRGQTNVTTVPLPDRSTWFWRVQSMDDNNDVSVWSVVQRFHVDTGNRPPTLSTSGLAPVSPARGTLADNFLFQVRYTDPEGDAPAWVRVTVDGTLVRDMLLQDPTSPNYVVGEIFEITIPGSALGIGAHTFRFSTDLGVADPALGTYPGPTIELYSISGRVTDPANQPIAGVVIRGGGQQTTTGADGRYTLSNLTAGTYRVTPSLDEYDFTPVNQPVTVNETNGDATNVNFVGTVRTYSIGGRVVGTGGGGLAGIRVSLGAQSTTTAADGSYLFTGLVAGDYTVTPSRSEWRFRPVSRTVTVNRRSGSAAGVDFTGERLMYIVSGYIADTSGRALAGVNVAMGLATTATGADGRYRFTNVPAGTYTLTPTLAEYTFVPVSQQATVGEAVGNATGVNFTGSRRTYSISGTITSAGAPLAGVKVRVDGRSTTTAADGTYSVGGLPAGVYTVTPERAEYTFAPPNRSVQVDETRGNATGVDFVGTRHTYSISGRITGDGSNLAGVQVKAGPHSATTGADGTYVITGLFAGTYTVTPSLAEWTFTPPNAPVTVNQTVGNATNVDFAGSRRTYSIAGRVTDGTNPVAGVQVQCGALTTNTAPDGTYQFTGLAAGNYTVTPSLAEWTFAPPSRAVTLSQTTGNAIGVNFVGTRKIYSISGTVTGPGGLGLAGVRVVANGVSTNTDAQGRYMLSGLLAGVYTVTPSRAEFGFDPASREVTVSETLGSQTNVNFVGARRTYSISGRVKNNLGNPMAGVQVTAGTASTATGADGTFTLGELAAGTYTVRPSAAEFSFAPPDKDVTVNATAGNATGVVFVGSPIRYTISGTVVDDSGSPLAGVVVTVDGRSTTTGPDGSYSMGGLAPGTYAVTPTKSEWGFAPASSNVTVNQTTGNATRVNFVGTPRLYTISGQVVGGAGAPLAGVQVTAGTRWANTGADGRYTITGLPAGTYDVVPFMSDFAFNPSQRQVTVNRTVGNATGVNFTGGAIFAHALSAGLNLVGVPCQPLGDTDPRTIFGTERVSRWDALATPPATVWAGDPGSDAFMAVAPGKGYAVRVPSARVITVPGRATPTNVPFGMTLGPNWNLVANPFNSACPFANFRASSPDVASYGQVYDPASGSYLIISDVPGVGVARDYLQPWEAMWVSSARRTNISIAPPVGAAAAESAEPQSLALGERGWVIPILAHAGSRADLTTAVGVSSNGTTLIVENAPTMPGTVDAYLVGAAGTRLAQSVQPAAAAATAWDFVVTTDLPSVEVVVSLPDLSAVPKDLSVTLTDVDGGRQVYARTMPRYTFRSNAEGVTVRHFRLTVAPEDKQALALTSVTAQHERGSVVVTYSVTAPCQATIRVLNISGRTVRTLVAGQPAAAGTNVVPWNLRNDAGSLVPSGAYLVSVEVVAENGQKVSNICPVRVVR